MYLKMLLYSRVHISLDKVFSKIHSAEANYTLYERAAFFHCNQAKQD